MHFLFFRFQMLVAVYIAARAVLLRICSLFDDMLFQSRLLHTHASFPHLRHLNRLKPLPSDLFTALIVRSCNAKTSWCIGSRYSSARGGKTALEIAINVRDIFQIECIFIRVAAGPLRPGLFTMED
jgi:hypothetical protein